MLSRFSSKELWVLAIALLPLGYLAYVYPSLPQTVPMHFDLYGKPNGYGSKSTMALISIIFSVGTLGLYLLIKFLPSIDPKKSTRLSASAFMKIGIAMVVFLSAMNAIIIYSSVSGFFNLSRLYMPLMGLFFIFIGNLMHSIKPNYFVGIRLPWTLEDPDNWRVTHQLGGKIWVAGGAFITLSSLIFPQTVSLVLMGIALGIMILVPIGYSFVYFKKTQKKQS